MVEKQDNKGKGKPEITRKEDGSYCIGSDCFEFTIPTDGDIKIDVSKCPDDVKKQVIDNIARGRSTNFKVSD